MLAKNWDPETHDPTGWLISEKLDGVRCYWNGTTMYTRNGKLFYPPQWFKDLLPKDLALDGELWTERDDFQKCVSIVRKQYQNEGWKKVTYMVYDAPLLDMPFEHRLAVIEAKLEEKPSKNVQYHKHIKCTSKEQLIKHMDNVLAQKGEGMMIKDPDCEYESKRSIKLLKVKKFEDTEATVIGHQKGTGRCSFMCGAIQMRGDNGVEFKIGSGFTDAQRRKPPKKGSRVTYKF